MSNSADRREAGARRLSLTAAALAAGLIGYEAIAHWAVVHDTGLGALIALGPALAALLWIAWRTRRRSWLTLAGAACLMVALLVLRQGLPSLTVLYPLPSIFAFLLMLVVFGRTLAPGREPLVTGLARRVHGTLPPEIEAYTRRVNWAWCVFFAAMALASALLFEFASLESWSLFVNVLTLPLIALMFVAEYAYRIARFRDFAHVPLLTAVRAFREWGRAALSTSRGG